MKSKYSRSTLATLLTEVYRYRIYACSFRRVAVSKSSLDDSFRKWERQLRKGLLAYLVLRELERSKHYGYSLIAALTRTLEANMAEGTIYPLLNRLEQDEMIESSWEIQRSGPARKYYRLTKLGRDLLAAMDQHWNHVSERVMRRGDA